MHPKIFFFTTIASYVVLLAIEMVAAPRVPETVERRRRRVEQAPTSGDPTRIYNMDMVGHTREECTELRQLFLKTVGDHDEAVALMQNKYKDFKLLFDDTLTRECMFSSTMLRGNTPLEEGTRVRFYESVGYGVYHRTPYFDEIENGQVNQEGHWLEVLPREYNSDVFFRMAPERPEEDPENAFEQLIANRWLAVIHADMRHNNAGFPTRIHPRVLTAFLHGNNLDQGSFSAEVFKYAFDSDNQTKIRSNFLYKRVQLNLNTCGIRLFYDQEAPLNDVRDQMGEAGHYEPMHNIQLYLSTVGKIIRFPANVGQNVPANSPLPPFPPPPANPPAAQQQHP